MVMTRKRTRRAMTAAISCSQKVFVYYNLHQACWSVKALSGELRGRVVAHMASITISDPSYRVSEAGRRRVLMEKRKNVHAGIVGFMVGVGDDSVPEGAEQIYYNPYVTESFVRKSDMNPAPSYRRIILDEHRCVWGVHH